MAFDPSGARTYVVRSEVLESLVGDSGSPGWSQAIGPISALAASDDGVYLARKPASNQLTIVKLDARTGSELARVDKTFGHSAGALSAMALFQGRVFVSLSNPSGIFFPDLRQTFASFDGATLAPVAAADFASTALYSPFFFDAALPTGYVAGHFCLRFSCSATIANFDPVTLQVSASGIPPVFGSIIGGGLGEARRPGPVRLRGAVTGTQITLDWQPDSAGAAASSFKIFRGRRGESLELVGMVDGLVRTWRWSGAETGSFTFAVVARNRNGDSSESRVDLGVEEVGVAGSPTNLSAIANDDVVQLAWRPAASGPVPSAYVIEASPRGAGVFVPVAQVTSPEFFARVPPGEWQARVRGVTAGGQSLPSEVITISSSVCATAPGPPGALAGGSTGKIVTLQWSAPAAGPPLEYELEVETPIGALVPITLSGFRADFQVVAPSGSYAVRVRARNDCGRSTPTNEVAVFVP
jgi:hypothetical protein